VWAHAEYLKLLRSAADGRVFDRISVVEERYAVPRGERSFTCNLEIFEVGRPIRGLIAGMTLRIADRNRFRVVFTRDNWVTTESLDSQSVGYPGAYADIPTSADRPGTITFTLAWMGADGKERWLGRNIDVIVIEAAVERS
jgi:glucoamylase